mgnify:CR=1 FL=1
MLVHRTVRGRATAVLAAGVLSLALAACGSQLSPDEFVTAGGGTAGVGVGTGTGTDGGFVDDGSGVVADGGTGTDTSGGSTGSTDGSSGGTSSSGGGSSSSGGDSGSSGDGGGQTDSSDQIKTGSCEGFKNGVGITDDAITIGNSSDISGPVPGLFEAAQDAVKAFVAYYNKANPDGICGRRLVLKNYDSQTQDSSDQRNHVDACENVFAMVGSMSAFDSGGAATTEACGLPDIRSAGVTGNRQQCKTCYGAQSTIAGEVANAVPDYALKNFPDAAQKAGMLYITAGAAQENGELFPVAYEKRGMNFDYVQGFGTSEFNYSPYVQQLKDRGIRYVQMTAAVPQFVRMAQAMQQQSYKPDVFMFDPTAYDPEFISSGGDAVEGATVFMNFVPFEEASSSPETALYLNWLQQTKPGATPTFFGVFSWSAARLFVEKAAALGGDLNRANLVQAVSQVKSWTANGLHAPQFVGPKRTGDCFRFVQVKNGRWVPVGGTKYTCTGTTVAR